MSNWKSRSKVIAVLVLAGALTGAGAYAKAREGGEANRKLKAVEADAALFLAPLNGAINLNAGTLEARFTLDYSFADSLRPAASGCLPFVFLQVYDGEGAPYVVRAEKADPAFTVVLQQSSGVHGLSFLNRFYYYEAKADPADPGAKQKLFQTGVKANKEKGPWFSAGEWHTLAVTWQIEKEVLRVELFLDGKSQGQRNFTSKESALNGFAKGDLLGLGGESLSPATLLAYRLSSCVRTKEEIASDAPLKSDATTTFFLDGETAGKIKVMKMKDFAGMRHAKKINLTQPVFIGEMKLVETPKGKAIQFYKKCSR
jgi:hypothetical protein